MHEKACLNFVKSLETFCFQVVIGMFESENGNELVQEALTSDYQVQAVVTHASDEQRTI